MAIPPILAFIVALTTLQAAMCQVADRAFRDLYCQQCQSLCPMHQSTGPTESTRVGKAGPPGPPGPPGSAGTVNLTDVERMVDRKLNEKVGFLFAPRNCDNFSEDTAKSLNVTGGLIDIFIPSYLDTKEVYCDVTTDGGNWIVFQRRMNGEVDFYRDWIDYVTGFGKPSREFWLGLETIHQLTNTSNTELRIDMIERNGEQYYAKYRSFYVGPKSDDYRLHVSGYSGNATDSFAHPPNSNARHNNQRFSTRDADHDRSTGTHCAVGKGGWWFNNCQWSNLNGKYDIVNDWPGVVWYHEKKVRRLHMKYTEMKFRRKL